MNGFGEVSDIAQLIIVMDPISSAGVTKRRRYLESLNMSGRAEDHEAVLFFVRPCPAAGAGPHTYQFAEIGHCEIDRWRSAE
jgi:hypothetical protein